MTVRAGAARQQDDDLRLEQQLCFALTVASRSIVGAYKPVLEKLGLTHPQYLVMLCLWESAPRSLRSISEALAQAPATISPLLRRLEEAGFVTRQRVDGTERRLAGGQTAAGEPGRQRGADGTGGARAGRARGPRTADGEDAARRGDEVRGHGRATSRNSGQ